MKVTIEFTEAVIVKTIGTASYALWRTIMGGRFEESDDSRYTPPSCRAQGEGRR